VHRAARATVLAAVLLGTFAGCSPSNEDASKGDAAADAPVDAPEDGWGTFTGTMQCGDIPVANPSCASCADDRCCEAGETCSANPACVSLRTCLAACEAEDDACADGCREAHAGGRADNAVLSACRMRWCSSECFDGAPATCGFSMPAAACDTCAQAVCCEAGWEAYTQPSFWAYADCVDGCKEASCFDACEQGNDEGRSYYYTFVGCLGTHCAKPCALEGTATCGGFYGPACGTCVQQRCCDVSLSCYEDVACVGLWLCSERCAGDTSCEQACEAQHATSAVTFEALRDCLAASCAGSCP
jgi:hypothetical protein